MSKLVLSDRPTSIGTVMVGTIRRFSKAAAALALGAAIAGTSCSRKAASDGSSQGTDGGGGGTTSPTGGGETTSTSTTVPQVGAISLSTLGTGTSTAGLTDSASCSQGGLGVMGLALNGACATAPLAARLLLGSDDGDFDGNGVTNCDDFTAAKAAGKDPGLMLHLMCENVVLNNDGVVSLAFTGDTAALALSFAPWTGDTNHAVGNWTQGEAASYPADIRLWSGSSLPLLKGFVSLALSDINNGTVQVADLLGGTGTYQAPTAVSFSNKTSTAGCAASPSEANCHWQDIQIYAGEGDTVNGPPNGLHLKVYADNKKAPTFLAIEGAYRYTAASAAHFAPAAQATCPGSQLASLRTAYFQVIQEGGQVWGRFSLRDENGALLTCNLAGTDPFATLAAAAGVCQNLGSAAWVACTDIKPASFTSLWTGESSFVNVTSTPVASVFDGAPTTAGICTAADGCRAFKASDGDAPQ